MHVFSQSVLLHRCMSPDLQRAYVESENDFIWKAPGKVICRKSPAQSRDNIEVGFYN